MDGVYGELDEAKLQIERLRSDHHKKVDQFENLKKMYDEQVDKLQRAIVKVDTQSQELREMNGELTFMKDLCEELKQNLSDKELRIEHLSAENYSLWSDLRLKLQESEEEKKTLVILLEESNLKSTSQEHELRALSEEIASLKALLESSRKKRSEMEETAKEHKEVGERDDIIGDLEDKETAAKLVECADVKSQMEILNSDRYKETAAELIECRSELIDKEVKLEEVKKELESCHSSFMHLMSQNEEITVMLLLMNSGISEAQIRLADDVAYSQMDYKRSDEHSSDVINGSEVKNYVLSKAYNEIVKKYDKVQNDVERCKRMLEESSRCHIYMREQVLKMETESKGKIREVYEASEKTGSELTERIDEANEIEFELQIWRSIAERLKIDMEEDYRTRIELEASLLAQTEVEDMIKRENDELLRRIEEKEQRIESLQDKNALLEQELGKVELKRVNVLSSEPSVPFEMGRNSLLRANTLACCSSRNH